MFVNPTHQKAHEALQKGELEVALHLLDELISVHAEHADLFNDRGVVHLHLGNQDSCYNDLGRAIELTPYKAYRYACRAFARMHFGDTDGAIEDYSVAITLDPDDAVAHNNMGLLLEQKGYYDEAKKRFERADKLAGAEDRLLRVIDELEGNEISASEKNEKQEMVEDEPSFGSTLIHTFTKKKQFKEFIQFIRNGFKLK